MNKTPKLLLATVLLCPVLLAFASGGSKLAFAVSEGSTKTRTFTSVVELNLDDMLTLMNGEEGPTIESEMSIESNLEIRVTDQFVSMRDGEPKKLRRSFDKLVQKTTVDVANPMVDQNIDIPFSSSLEGEDVIFTWNPEKDAYDVAFPDEEGDEELLIGLTEDMDLRGFLPAGEVAEGDEWAVDPEALSGVLVPGGNVKLIPDDAEGAEMMGGMNADMGDFADWFSEDIEGSIKARFEGVRETDTGTEVGVIAIRVEITNAVDMTEDAQEQLEQGELPFGVDEMEISVLDLQLTLESKGTLLWNLEEGCAYSLELSGEFELSVDTTVNLSLQEMEMELETSMDLSGTLTSTARIE